MAPSTASTSERDSARTLLRGRILRLLPRLTGASTEIRGRRSLVFSPADSTALYFGTQYVMKTVDGGLHWQIISPDLTGAEPQAAKSKCRDRLRSKMQSSAVTAWCSRLRLAVEPRSDLGGKRYGIDSLDARWGKNWKNVTPQGVTAWSKISLDRSVAFRSCGCLCRGGSQPARRSGTLSLSNSRLRCDVATDYGWDWGATLSCAAFGKILRKEAALRGNRIGSLRIL